MKFPLQNKSFMCGVVMLGVVTAASGWFFSPEVNISSSAVQAIPAPQKVTGIELSELSVPFLF